MVQVNKPPRFTSQIFTASVSEGALGGAAVTTIAATTLNTVDSLSYSITGANPPGALGWWALDPLLGTLSVAPGIPGGALLVDRTFTYPAPWAVNISLLVTNAGGLTASAAVIVSVVNIAPRVTAQVNATVRNNATGLTPVVASLGGAVWTPYSASTLRYSLTSAVTVGLGLGAFVLTNSTTGAIAVANVSYADPHSGAPILGPDFNINEQPTVTSAWIVTDSATGRSCAAPGGSLVVAISHSNRPPFFSLPPVTTVITAPQTTAAPFGQALGVVTSDPDLSLNLGAFIKGVRFVCVCPCMHTCIESNPTPSNAGERLTFWLASGSVGGAIVIDPVSGQLSVTNASAFTVPHTLYPITVGVRDAGIDGPVFSVLRNFTVNITLSFQPPAISAYSFSVPELSVPGTLVGLVRATSNNFQAALTYTLVPTAFVANFPFLITSAGGVGNISVGAGASLLFGPGPRQYDCTLTVTDNNPAGAMYASSAVTISVTYVPRPPYFNAATQVPGSAWFQLQVRGVSRHAVTNRGHRSTRPLPRTLCRLTSAPPSELPCYLRPAPAPPGNPSSVIPRTRGPH